MTHNEQNRPQTTPANSAALTRILLVEDDASIAGALGRLIRRGLDREVEIITTALGEVAIAELEVGGYDLVISDYNLAGEATGADVLAAAGATPFLFLSSDERAESLGVRWLAKPCAPSALRAVVRSMLARPQDDEGKVVRMMPLDGAFLGDAA